MLNQSNKIKLRVYKLSKDAIIPVYGTDESAGFDFYCIGANKEPNDSVGDDDKITFNIFPGEVIVISTGLCFEIPKGYYLSIVPRSSLATKRGLTVANAPGTVDSDYRGEVKVAILNTSNNIQTISIGERVAQGILMKHETAQFVEVNSHDELCATKRGAGGFGSTGRY